MIGNSRNEFLKGIVFLKKDSSIFHATTVAKENHEKWIKVENVEILVISEISCIIRYEDTGWRYNDIEGFDVSNLQFSMTYSNDELEDEYVHLKTLEVKSGFFGLKKNKITISEAVRGWVKLKNFKTQKFEVKANNWYIETHDGVSKNIGI